MVTWRERLAGWFVVGCLVVAAVDVAGLLPASAVDRATHYLVVYDHLWTWALSDPPGDGYIAAKRPDGTDEDPPTETVIAAALLPLSCVPGETYDLVVRGYAERPAGHLESEPSEASDLVVCEPDPDLTRDGIVGGPDFGELVRRWRNPYGIEVFVSLVRHYGDRVCAGELLHVRECPPNRPQRGASADPERLRLAAR